MTNCPTCGRETGEGEPCPRCAPLPTVLGKYKLLGCVGRGGMGEVYKAFDPDFGTVVAVKILRPPEAVVRIDLVVKRFMREAQIGARLRHPGIVRVREAGQDGPRLYMVMEFVDGESLQARIERGPLDPRRSIEIARDAAGALHAAHEQGVLHRDVKPANILVDAMEQVRIVDFGLARIRDADETLTQTGALLGTAEYMAPEQLLAPPDELDGRTDVYSLGAVLYEMLTGGPPIPGKDLFEVLRNVENFEPPPPSSVRGAVPAETSALTMKAMAKDREKRFASAAEMASAIERLLGKK